MHTLTRVTESAARPERGINSQSLCIVRQRNRNRRNRRTNEVHAAAAERAVVAKAGTRHLETFHPSKVEGAL